MPKASLLSKTDTTTMENNAIASITVYGNSVLEIKSLNSTIDTASKYCYLQDFVNAFNDVSVKTGLIPPGTIAYSEGNNEQYLLFCLPPHTRPISFRPGDKTFEYNVNLPYTIWSFVISKGYIQTTRTKLFLSDRIPLAPEHSYFFPFGNVFDRCEICWGSTFSNTEATKKFQMWDAISVTDRFFGSVFNGHLDKEAATNIQFLRDNSFSSFVKQSNKYKLDPMRYKEIMAIYEK
jgi:hypothetical protein